MRAAGGSPLFGQREGLNHGAAIGERDCGSLADSIAKTEPFIIILFTEPLAFEHARRKEYAE